MAFWGSKKFLGVDIGTSAIRVVELRKKGRKIKLENYGEIDTSFLGEVSVAESKKDGFLVPDNNIAKAIQAICKEAGIKTKKANFSIPDFRSFFTSFKVPTMAKGELTEAVKYEVRPYIPLPLSEITLDWTITEGVPAKTPLKVLVVAIPNEIIRQYQLIARLCNLKLKILESEVFALARALVKSNKEDYKKKKKISSAKVPAGREIIGLIDIGSRTSTCSVVDKGCLKISHSFSIAGNELTERLAKSLNIDYNKSKELIEKYGLSSGSPQNIREILTPLIDSLIQDAKKIFQAFYRTEGKEVEKIFLAGGMASVPGLKEYFFNEFKKETITANPFLDISCPPILKNTLAEIGANYAIAVGSAMKGLE